MKYLSIIIMIFFLINCNSHQDRLKQTKAEIELIKTQSMQQKQTFSLLKHVKINSSYYVPKLDKKLAFKPNWWFEKINNLSLIELSLHELMRELNHEYQVNYQLSEQLDITKKISLNFTGTIGKLIEQIAQQTNYHYIFQGDVLHWQKFTTKIMELEFIPGHSQYQFSSNNYNHNLTETKPRENTDNFLQDTQLQEIVPEQSSQANYQLTINLWSELVSTMELLKSPEGQYRVSQASSNIVIKDLPTHVQAMSNYIEQLNHKLATLIAVDVQIIEVRMNEGFNYGINWNIVRNTLAGNGTANLITNFNQNNFSDLAPTIISYEVTNPSSDFTGSNLLLQALEQQGHVSVVNAPRAVTLNSQMAEIAITEQTTYLAAASTRSTANVGAETALQPGTIEAGLKLFVLPLLVGDSVLLQIHADLSTLQGIKVVESGGSKIEAPSVLDKKILQKVKIPLGKTLLLAGLTTASQSTDETGLLGQPWLNGSQVLAKQLSEVIILITPHVLN